MVIRGLRRAAQRPIHRTLPVTPQIIRQILATPQTDPHCAIQYKTLTVLKAVALLYFLTMLRSSDLIPAFRKKINVRQVLTWGDISRIHHGIVITIRHSKTIQNNERVHPVPLAASPAPFWCPVRTLDALVTIFGSESCRPHTPVFRIPSKSGKSFVALEKRQFNRWFKQRLAAHGHDPDAYTLHGFRHGSIQQAMLVEQNMGLVAVTSDHSSNAINAYTAIPPERHMRVSANMLRSLTDPSL